MTPLVPITMFGWIAVSVASFYLVPPERAVVFSVVAGVLFLPMASYNLPGLPAYDKYMAIAVGVLLAGWISGRTFENPLYPHWYDLPMVLWCFAVPFATALTNDLGWYDGVSTAVRHYARWGVFFWAGRKYLGNASGLRTLTWGFVFGGLAYVPLILFEVRMSPQLSNILYGFFPHTFAQHWRYGGFRPIVFMQHGLMVALWMAVCATVAYWLWRTGRMRRVWRLPAAVVVMLLLVATVLSRSANGWIFVTAGFGAALYFKWTGSTRLLRLMILAIPVYMVLRLTNVMPLEHIESSARLVLDEERTASLAIRLRQEDLFGVHALNRPWFGWGGHGRNWPVNPETGARLIGMVDALWVIAFSGYGFLGLTSIYLSLGIGPWCVLRRSGGLVGSEPRLPAEAIASEEPYGGRVESSSYEASVYPVILSLIVTFFMLDSLMNAILNPVYVLAAGALVSYHLMHRRGNQGGDLGTVIADLPPPRRSLILRARSYAYRSE